MGAAGWFWEVVELANIWGSIGFRGWGAVQAQSYYAVV